MKQEKRSANKYLVLSFFVICLIMSIGLWMQRSNLLHKQEMYAAQLEELKKEEQSEEDRGNQLKKLEDRIHTIPFYEETAREKFGLVYPDEIVIKADKLK